MWNRIWQQTVGSDIPLDGRNDWLRWLVAAFGIWLVFATLPLWLHTSDFPQVPWFTWGCAVPQVVDVVLLCAMIGALPGAAAIRPDAAGNRLCLWLFAGAMTGLILLDQHRAQPWAYQLVLVAVILASTPAPRAMGLLRVLTISIYFHSAVSKCDYSFCTGLGRSFLLELGHLAFGRPPAGALPWETGAWPLLFPLGELAVAVGLIWPPVRRWAVWAACGMHLILLVVLGPWGLGHSPGVLIWNFYFILQNVILFGRTSKSVNLPVAASVNTERSSFAQWSVNLLVASVVLWPAFEPWGWCDVWPAWGLYAQHGEQLSLRLTDRGLQLVPIVWQESATRIVDMHEEPGKWQLRPQAVSLKLVSAPIYPQNRFQLGLMLDLAQRSPIPPTDVSAIWYYPANRWNGARRSIQLNSLADIERAADQCWWNARPRR